MLAISLALSRATTPGAIIISEIMYDPGSTPDNDWEYVEIHNTGVSAIDLTGYVLDDSTLSLGGANIATGSISAGGYAVLYDASSLSLSDVQNAWGSGINFVGVASWQALNNTGDRIGIWEDFTSYGGGFVNAIIDVDYDDSSPWPTPNNSASIYLTDFALDANSGTSWARSLDGMANAFTSAAAGANLATNVGSPGIGPVVVPEPSRLLFVLMGVFGMALTRRR